MPLYLAILLALWTALVLSNSKGGLLAMGVQLIVSLILFTSVRASAGCFAVGRHLGFADVLGGLE